jgi:hypothetical protein
MEDADPTGTWTTFMIDGVTIPVVTPYNTDFPPDSEDDDDDFVDVTIE